MQEIEHELPCGHSLPTEALVERITHFATSQLRGSLDCPVCGEGCQVEFARMNVSTGTLEHPETFVATGRIVGGPGSYFESHHRRRVQGLRVDGQLVQWRGREWILPAR
jgi:hypothetical protein